MACVYDGAGAAAPAMTHPSSSGQSVRPSSPPSTSCLACGKVDVTKEQMVYAEATSVLPLIASDAYHKAPWKNRDRKNFSKIFG